MLTITQMIEQLKEAQEETDNIGHNSIDGSEFYYDTDAEDVHKANQLVGEVIQALESLSTQGTILINQAIEHYSTLWDESGTDGLREGNHLLAQCQTLLGCKGFPAQPTPKE